MSMGEFWDRGEELDQIHRRVGRPGFGYVTGRRRVGKTALLKKAVERFGGVYHQAVEGLPPQQLLHLVEELRGVWPIFREITPRTWNEFFRLLSRERFPRLLVFDEFPYWVEGDPTLPSQFQKWIDHELPKRRTFVLVSGSSQSMLYSQFLNPSAPLYGRASFHLRLRPMSYRWFCRALAYELEKPESFARFTLVGGVPHYWRMMPKRSLVEQAEALYFEPVGILAEEPTHMIQEEGITGSVPKGILDLVGRGVAKPSELASRLGTPQGNLSRPLALLLELGLLHRELPFGESVRTTKRVLYNLQDPALSFYYGTYLPFQSRWNRLSLKEKRGILQLHVSRQWEHFCRQAYPGSARYWEREVELDLVWSHGAKGHLVAECKWTLPTTDQERRILQELKERFSRTKLAGRFKRVEFRLFTQKDLATLCP